ncbi:MAG: hypothetical protein JW395_1481 [Nitrospira sp.]|nr:hypothetical protein [Nitrospira sp.]
MLEAILALKAEVAASLLTITDEPGHDGTVDATSQSKRNDLLLVNLELLKNLVDQEKEQGREECNHEALPRQTDIKQRRTTDITSNWA